jgi:hypothetical protein
VTFKNNKGKLSALFADLDQAAKDAAKEPEREKLPPPKPLNVGALGISPAVWLASKDQPGPRVVIMTMHDISLQPKNAKNNPNARIGPNSALELAGTVKTYRYLDEEESAESEAAAKAAPAVDKKGGK